MNEMMLKALMDPAGAPAHPVLFLVLGVVTFALHMVAVNIMLGTLGLSLWGAFTKNSHMQRLSAALAATAKIAVSFVIVLGVAPLLFVQVIYDPFWYTSNVISAWWVLIFLGLLIVGYLMLYRVYYMNHTYADDGSLLPHTGNVKGVFWLAVALVIMILCGLIIHSVSNQAYFPHEWMNWYAPEGNVDPSGRSLHYFLLPRLLFFLLLSLPVTGARLFGMRRYLLSAGETDYDYIDFIEVIAHKISLVGAVLVTLAGVWWMAALPETMVWFSHSAWIVVALLPLGYFLAMSFIQRKRKLCIFCNYMSFVMAVVMVMVLAALREVLRFVTLLQASGWNALDYKISMDWPSTLIFFVTFLVVGGLNIAYLGILAWQSGQSKGQYQPSAKIHTLGKAAVISLAAWVIGYFVIGLCVMD